jgi:hypothetical protein
MATRLQRTATTIAKRLTIDTRYKAEGKNWGNIGEQETRSQFVKCIFRLLLKMCDQAGVVSGR